MGELKGHSDRYSRESLEEVIDNSLGSLIRCALVSLSKKFAKLKES